MRTSLINLALLVETALVVWTGYVFYKWSLANAGSEPFAGLLPYRGSFALVLAPWLIASAIIPASLIVLAVAESKSISKRMVLVPMLLILVALIAVSYWHVYARPRVLSNHGVQATDKPVLEGAFQLVPEGIGSALSGIIVSQKESWIINRVMVDVRIRETRHCGENSPSLIPNGTSIAPRIRTTRRKPMWTAKRMNVLWALWHTCNKGTATRERFSPLIQQRSTSTFPFL